MNTTMELETSDPTPQLPTNDPSETITQPTEEPPDAESTVHGFLNITTNTTVIERPLDVPMDPKRNFCEGSDSGVEVVDTVDFHRALSSNSGASQDCDNACARSRDSSISYCSNYEEAYSILVRKNSTLLEDYTLRNGDVTSENGSESSSLSGSHGGSRRNHVGSIKKKPGGVVDKKKEAAILSKERTRSKPPMTPASRNSLSCSTAASRLKSVERVQTKPTNSPRANSVSRAKPNNLDLGKLASRRPASAVRANQGRITAITPVEDSRSPSNKPPPSIVGSYRDPRPKFSQTDNKTIEKYATLPRRRKEKPIESTINKSPSTQTASSKKSSTKEIIPSRMFSSLYLPKSKARTKIYHEINVQTALTMCDIDNALAGKMVCSKDPEERDRCLKEVQVDIRDKEMESLREQLKRLGDKYESLVNAHKEQTEKLKETENKLKDQQLEKEGLIEELNNNSQRVLAILGQAESDGQEETAASSDSLLVLENRFQNVSQVIIQQEDEIARLNNYCRSFQLDLEKSLAAQKSILQQHQDLEAESIELQEFMQAEKSTLADALKEAENEVKKLQQTMSLKDKDLSERHEECKQLSRLCEQRRLENLGLQARIANLEAKSRELLVHQGSTVSGASVALSSLIDRLSALADELIGAYSISEQELDDVIFHNEVYNNGSSVESTPEKSMQFGDQKLSPNGKGSSFVSAVINAIKNATSGRDSNRRKDSLCDRSSSNEMLDSETEPCLMMEHVLEDVVIPDGYSHNMISSGHGSMLSSRLTHSESLKDVSNYYFNRQYSEPTSLNTSFTSDIFSLSEIFPPISLVDQVIEVDNVTTRLLKVIRIIQIENEDCMSELQDQRDSLTEQVDKQKETNKLVVKQLKDWEILGARLKTEVKELMSQLSKKNSELDGVKAELNKRREQIEKLNQDVCDLSTALSKAELEMRVKEEEVEHEVSKYQENGDVLSSEVIARISVYGKAIPELRSQLMEKDKRLKELNQEFLAGKQVLTESLKEAVKEAKRQYDAIDNALEVLHTIQSVVKQCPPLSKLQGDLEEASFQSASSMPVVSSSDFNANAGLIQSVTNMEITPPINTTA
ncbi:putative leucine-rich repeat-containing protein DDB_G0290503 [Euwallacea similis]|uniref:putative leucine-rich repeat-containing protein DDB_G0290503 n=1 Tax=Euwallacea similis TaxID=1736056 RepID=UPI0034510210